MRKMKFILVIISALIIVGVTAQTKTPSNSKPTSLQQVILQLEQQPTGNINKAIIKKKLSLINQGLKIDANNVELLYQKALIFADIERYKLGLNIVNKLLQQDSTNKKYLKLQKVLKQQLVKSEQVNLKLTENLKKNPQDLPTRLKLIESEITLHNYKNALKRAKTGLKLHPNNEALLYKQMLIYIDMEQYQQAKKSLTQLSKTKPGEAKAEPLATMINREAKKEAQKKPKPIIKPAKVIAPEKPAQPTTPVVIYDRPFGTSAIAITGPEKNFISFEGYPTSVRDLRQTWFYNYLSYGHKTDNVTYMLGVDHIYRDGDNGFRYRAELYPKLNKYLYFHFVYAYSNSFLFPKHYGLFRTYILLPQRFELSFGGRYYRITDNNLWAYSVWLSKFFGHNWFAIRPVLYSSDTTDTVLYLTGVYRYYFAEPNHYIALSAGRGETPDLLDLDASGFEIIHAWHAFASYQQPITKTFFVSVGAGYAREKFPKGLVRPKWSALVGFKKLF